MRIDAPSLPVSLDRSPRQGTASSAYRQIQQDTQQTAQRPDAVVSPAPGSSTSGLQVYSGTTASSTTDSLYGRLPATQPDQDYQPRLNNRAAQAIASYSSTAAFVADSDGPQVVGLDLFA